MVLDVINTHTHRQKHTAVILLLLCCIRIICLLLGHMLITQHPPSAQSLAEPLKCYILRSTLTSGSKQLIMPFIPRLLSRRVRTDTARSRVTYGLFLLANLLFIKFDHLLKMTSQGQTRVRLHTQDPFRPRLVCRINPLFNDGSTHTDKTAASTPVPSLTRCTASQG